MSLHPGSAVPVVYELDDNNEANGLVHPFCSQSCLVASMPSLADEVASRGFTTTPGMSDGIDSQCVCEQCGKPIYRV